DEEVRLRADVVVVDEGVPPVLGEALGHPLLDGAAADGEVVLAVTPQVLGLDPRHGVAHDREDPVEALDAEEHLEHLAVHVLGRAATDVVPRRRPDPSVLVERVVPHVREGPLDARASRLGDVDEEELALTLAEDRHGDPLLEMPSRRLPDSTDPVRCGIMVWCHAETETCPMTSCPARRGHRTPAASSGSGPPARTSPS